MYKIYVIAGSEEQYKRFLRIMCRTPRDCVYVTSMQQIAGIRPLKLFVYGTWYKQSEFDMNRLKGIAYKIYEVKPIIC